MMKKSTLLKLAVGIALVGCIAIRPVRAHQGVRDNYVFDEVNVILAPGVSIDAINARYGTTIREQIPGTTYYRLATPGGTDGFDVDGEMAGDIDLASSDLNYTFEQSEVTQASQAFLDQASQAFLDGLYPASFYGQPSIQNLRLSQAQAISKGAGATVAVIDTGIDFSHPLFAGRIAPAYYDFVDNDFNPTDEPNGPASGHGTFVAGLVALAAPQAAIMPVRAFGPDGTGTSFNIAKAIRFAHDNGATVINMSFGLIEQDKTVQDALTYASDTSYMVAASGNDNLDFLQFPSVVTNRICAVASTTADDLKAPFSNYNKNTCVSAPGVSLYSAYPGGIWAYWTGTSFSTALVSAEAAQMLALNPSIGHSNVTQIISQSGISIDGLNPSYNGKLGKRMDYLNAVNAFVTNYTTTHTLSIGRSGNGTVTASPAGVDRAINCGATCSAKYIQGTTVTLTATPAPGLSFVSWTNGCVSSTPTCMLVIGKDTTAQANFK
jgi:subtilisin family serine protease